jgi:molybdenum cofactor cytidylyltransferase
VKLGVVILGAGASSRMGRPKLLLPWGDTTILGHLLREWRGTGAAQVAVVQALEDEAMRRELDRLGHPPSDRIANPQPERGMFSSIQCAAAWPGWQPELTHQALVLGDQPHLRTATLRALVDFAATHPDRICQPQSPAGRPRHPVILPAPSFQSLPNAADETLKSFLQRHEPERVLCPLDDPGLDVDLDFPADYERAHRTSFGRTP